MAEEWRQLHDQEKEKYDQIAQQDRKRYEAEKKIYIERKFTLEKTKTESANKAYTICQIMPGYFFLSKFLSYYAYFLNY